LQLLKNIGIWFSKKKSARKSLDVRYALLEACVIGVVSALAALLLKQGINGIGSWRLQAVERFGAWSILPLMGLVSGALAGWAIEQYSPESAGSGIPHVKAILARFSLPLSFRVAVVKTIGTILVLGAGFTLGRRGPTVHIGAALAAQLNNWFPTSPEHRRYTIAAGAAAGLAASFNTPIAGMLFVVEELMRDISGLTLETAIVASFTGAVVSRILGSADLNLPAFILNSAKTVDFLVEEIPLYLILGVVAGVSGCIFNRCLLFGMKVNANLNLALSWRIGLAGLLSGAIVACLPPFFQNNAGLREFLIVEAADWQTYAIATVSHFFLTVIAYSSGAPGGLFAPALVIGSGLGYLVGNTNFWFVHSQSADIFALAGMAAFFTGVVRIPLTAIVMVFELTGNFKLVLPLMISCAIAYIVAESIFPGSIYQHLLKNSGINLQDDVPQVNDLLTRITAAEVMKSKVEVLSPYLNVREAIAIISQSRHRGFPVVEGNELIGIVTQKDFEAVGNDKVLIKDICSKRPIVVQPQTPLSEVLYLLNRYQISRLPVTENERLVGIITRSDIIKVQAERLAGKYTSNRPFYTVYQTKSPASGRGRILLPIANPHNFTSLLKIAGTIARYRHYELECLQVIEVPKHINPSRAAIDTSENRQLMRRIERSARIYKIPIHTQIKFAHNRSEAILQTIQERHINTVIIGWKDSERDGELIFDSVVDFLIKNAPCELAIVKLGKSQLRYPEGGESAKNWLLPVAGGPNLQTALQLLPALAGVYNRSYSPNLVVCHVEESEKTIAEEALETTIAQIGELVDFPIAPIGIQANSVASAIIDLANRQECNLVLLGASRKGFLEQAIQGNIPRAIARGVNGTVIIVKS
jgi:CIC family chloride channel protein